MPSTSRKGFGVARLESGPPHDLFLGSLPLSLVPANDMKEAVTAANAGARPLKVK